MKNISLRINDRTEKLELLKKVEDILSSYDYGSDKLVDYLSNTYPYFMNLISLFDNGGYTDDELIVIANTIYFNKGSTQSIRDFMRFFNISGDVTYDRILIKLTSDILEASSTSFEIFVSRFKEFCNDVLIYQTNSLDIKTLLIECKLINKTSDVLETIIINNIA